MKPSLWGKKYWFVIHVTALKYPDFPTEEDKEAYKHFYSDMWRFLPCKLCSDHYIEHLADLPIDEYLENRSRMFEWTVKLHNKVNVSIGKPTMSLSDAKSYYSFPDGGAFATREQLYTQHDAYALNALMFVNVIVIVLVAIFMVYVWKKHVATK